MIIDRQIKPFTIASDESVINALQKMCQTGSRIIMLVSDAGELEGVFTDGDLRHWLARHKDADLNQPVCKAANKSFISARANSSPETIDELFSEKIRFVPLTDSKGRLVAVARKDESFLKLGEITLDASSPVFVIAEIGNNHNGDIALAKQLVDHAVNAGADCVKFQMRHMEHLYRGDPFGKGDDEDLGVQYVMDLLTKFQLSDEDLFEVFEYSKAQGIMPMCTPWDLSSLKALEGYGMEAYKVSSADLTNHELLEALAKTGKPLIVSTGMSEEQEIIDAVKLLNGLGAPIILLHCNSTYPAPFHDLNLRYLERLKEINNGGIVGYSGHERGYHAVLAAVALGAKVIEKHLTIDRSMEGNDHKVSLLPGEFGDMIRAVREVEQSLGVGGERKPSQGEIINRSTLAKSLMSSRRIEIGETITEDVIIIRSPGRGLQPDRLNELLGRKTKRIIEPFGFFFASDLSDESHEPRSYHFRRPWGVPVRYHDFKSILGKTNPGLLEFHLSYRDLDLDFSSYFTQQYKNIDLVVHAPELFAEDHILDLCSFNDEYHRRSLLEMQRVIDLTRALNRYFPQTKKPLIVTNVGGFSLDKPLSAELVTRKIQKLKESLGKLDRDDVEIIPQTMPPFPWHMGGQSFHNLFIKAAQILEICKYTGLRVCFDVSHSKLACNQLKDSFKDFVEIVGPKTAHLHIADALGVDGEGLQIGEGDIDFKNLAEMLDNCCPNASFIPEIWQGHKNDGEGFWSALAKLEGIF
jgi:sialic acid synthase SpsE/sugar phosphate isomerase/epimerase